MKMLRSNVMKTVRKKTASEYDLRHIRPISGKADSMDGA
jgi:hypothetical protein